MRFWKTVSTIAVVLGAYALLIAGATLLLGHHPLIASWRRYETPGSVFSHYGCAGVALMSIGILMKRSMRRG
jgi:hypothetical protein